MSSTLECNMSVDEPSVIIAEHFARSIAAAARVSSSATFIRAIARASEAVASALEANGRVFSCGNGGSMSDAMHFAEELSGRFRGERPPLAATAISDPAHITCVANDYGYGEIFARYIEAHGYPGDILVCLSTSGRSPNVIAACRRAQEREMVVVGLTGQAGSPLGSLADIEICAQTDASADLAQEIHITALHAIVASVEALLGHAHAT